MTESPTAVLDRRSLFIATAAAATTAALQAKAGAASNPIDVRGTDGIYHRLPDLDVESRGEFLLGMSNWNNGGLGRAAADRARQILATNEIQPEDTVPFEKSIALLSGDPVIAAYAKSRSTHQHLKYRMLQTELHKRADFYLAALEEAEKLGRLELNTGVVLPEYTRREIHTQPGGYVGDPFAGFMYRYGSDWGVLGGRNYQDETHKAMAANVPVPTDRRVRRILDLGTSIGQLATSLKLRFPEAEVWGIDAGAPMLRYANMKAVDMGVDVKFSHRLAEDTKFPDGHFDIITANILFHETPESAAHLIIKEVARVLRPGGVFFPIDFYTAGSPPRTAWQHFNAFWNHRWNNEDWMLEYAAMDFNGSMKNAGLIVQNGPQGRLMDGGPSNVMGVKPA